jgi:hypothetical protein
MVAWSQLVQELGAPAGPSEMATEARQRWIVDQVRKENYVADWRPITTRWGDWEAQIWVSTQPIRLGDETDSIIPIVSARTAQQIADALGGFVLTPRLYDALAVQGELIDYVRDHYHDVADISRAAMVSNSRKVDELIAARGPSRELWAIGKQWVVTPNYNPANRHVLRNGANTGINYGAGTFAPAGPGGQQPWQSVSRPDLLRVWQPPGGTGKLWHDLDHVDISQKSPTVAQRRFLLTNRQTGFQNWEDLEDIAGDAELHRVVSALGPLSSLRIPIEDAPRGGGGTSPGPHDPTPAGHKPAGSSWTRGAVGAILVVAATAGTLYYLARTR